MYFTIVPINKTIVTTPHPNTMDRELEQNESKQDRVGQAGVRQSSVVTHLREYHQYEVSGPLSDLFYVNSKGH